MRYLFMASLMALIAFAALPALAADAAKGAMVYKRCALCHAIEPGKKAGIGPNLFAVVGRKAGATAFNYSTALKASGIIWTPAKLDAYITKPSALVKGTKMVYAGLPNPKDRADLIEFLKSKK